MAFAKLDSGIVNSSIWAEPLATRIVWITILALKDSNGFVACARSGLQRAANVSIEDFDIAINSLESPDADSRTLDNEGRRIAKIEGGWVVLNNEKYRLHDDIQREKTKERVKKFREKNTNVTLRNVTDTLPSVSVSVSVSEEGECKGETKKENNNYFESFWKQYPRKEGKAKALQAWNKIKSPKETLDLIVTALAWQTKIEQWEKENGQFIPMPTTYLNANRWLDEPQKVMSHNPAKEWKPC